MRLVNVVRVGVLMVVVVMASVFAVVAYCSSCCCRRRYGVVEYLLFTAVYTHNVWFMLGVLARGG